MARVKDTEPASRRQSRRPVIARGVSERAIARRWFVRRVQLAQNRGDRSVVLSLRLARALAIEETDNQTATLPPVRPSAA